MEDFIENLRARLAGPLPGRPAQFKMASLRRLQEIGPDYTPPPDARVACVLNLLHFSDGAWRTVLIRRTANPHDRHSGQVSFPGGRREETDGGLPEAALRETEEEVGVPSDHIDVLGALTDLYIPVSNFRVHPFVGVLRGAARFSPQPGEVEDVLTPPLTLFADANNRKKTDLTTGQGLLLREVPYFDVGGHVVWGATAMIMAEFVELAF